MATTLDGVGITDTAPGAGIADMLAAIFAPSSNRRVQTDLDFPIGDPVALRLSGSFTPPLISETLPPITVSSYTVPTGKALIVDGGYFFTPVADENLVRLCRRWRLYGHNAVAAPAAPAAPAVALVAHEKGMDVGTYSYKVAPVNALGQEGTASVASANVVTTATSRAVDVTLAALPAGASSWRIYRPLAGGATWFFLDEATGSPYRDTHPDADLDQGRTPALTWATGEITGDVADGPCELVYEIFAATAAAPNRLVYVDQRGKRENVAVAPALTLGTRLRMKLKEESRALVTTPTQTAHMIQGQHVSNFGASAVNGFNNSVGTHGGCVVVWGYQPLGVAWWPGGSTPAAGSVIPFNFFYPRVVLPPGAELTIDIGTTVAAAAGVREAIVTGRLVTV